MSISTSSCHPHAFQFWWNKTHSICYFFVLLHHQADYFSYLEWLSSMAFWRKKKTNLCPNIRRSLNGKIIVKMIALKKLVRKSTSPAFFKKTTHPCTILPTLWFIGSLVPRGRIKFTPPPPPKKKMDRERASYYDCIDKYHRIPAKWLALNFTEQSWKDFGNGKRS